MSTPSKRTTAVATTMAFQKFWTWLQGHVNCIVRAGTPESVLFGHGGRGVWAPGRGGFGDHPGNRNRGGVWVRRLSATPEWEVIR